jgi:hypothetical protein
MIDETLVVSLFDVETTLEVGAEGAPTEVVISADILLEEPTVFTDEPGFAATVDLQPLLTFVEDDLPTFPPARLLETVAERVARFALSLPGAIREVVVTVEAHPYSIMLRRKPGAYK